MFARILIATDLTDASKPALDRGVELARHLGASVLLLHVTDPPFDPPRWHLAKERMPLSARDADAEQHQAVHVLQAYVAEHRDEVPVEIRVVPGAPSDAIPSHAKDWNADLVVIGTHGRRGVRALILGSVADKVVRSSPCPVLTVRC